MEEIVFNDEDGLVIHLNEINCIRFLSKKNEIKLYKDSPNGEFTYRAENIIEKIKKLIEKSTVFYKYEKPEIKETFYINLRNIYGIDTNKDWFSGTINFKNKLSMSIKNFTIEDSNKLASELENYYENTEINAAYRKTLSENEELREEIKKLRSIIYEIHNKTQLEY